MTPSDVIQLYAPLAGLLAVVFWLGVLSQRVKTLERALDDANGGGSSSERIVRLETKMDGVVEELKSINRSLGGVQRQLGNISAKTLHDLSAVG